MNKLLAIIRREYVQGVRSKIFLISTILGPLLMVVFTVVPGLLFGLKTGGALRLAIVDQTGRIYDGVRESIMQELDSEEGEEADAGGVQCEQRAGDRKQL